MLSIEVSNDEKEKHTHYSSDGHDEPMNETAKPKSTSQVGARRQTQMGAKRREQLNGVDAWSSGVAGLFGRTLSFCTVLCAWPLEVGIFCVFCAMFRLPNVG